MTSITTLAKVMAATGCVAASGSKERIFLAERFHIERVVTSHDPKRINFSENTAIHECLLVARRSPSAEDKATEFFSLRRMPTTPEEAIAASEAIAGGQTTEWGSRTLWPAERVEAGDWTPVQWFDGQLAEIAYRLSQDSHLEPAGLRHRIGPEGRRIRDAYRKCSAEEPNAVPVFWSVSTSTHRTMRSSPEGWGRPKEAKQSLAGKYWNQRSQVLVAQRHRTTNGLLTAIWSPETSVGSGWVPVSVDNKTEGTALAAWWNSTPARIMLLNQRTKTLTYPAWSLAQLRSIRIPRPGNPAWSALTEAWEAACDIEMAPLSQGEECKARRIIDRAAAGALQLDEEQVAEWRRMLAIEPTISNRPAPHPSSAVSNVRDTSSL